MPIYLYRCRRGHVTEALVKFDESNAPASCQHVTDATPTEVLARCEEALERQMTAPASSFPGADSWRK